MAPEPPGPAGSGEACVGRGIRRFPPLEIRPVADDDGRVVAGYRLPEAVELLAEDRLASQERWAARCANGEELVEWPTPGAEGPASEALGEDARNSDGTCQRFELEQGPEAEVLQERGGGVGVGLDVAEGSHRG